LLRSCPKLILNNFIENLLFLMLSNKYFDGTMKRQLDEIIMDFNKTIFNKEVVIEKKKDMIFDLCDLLIDEKILDNGMDFDKDLQICFLTCCRKSKIRYRKIDSAYIIEYPVIDGKKTAVTKEYKIAQYKLHAFYFCKIYTTFPDISLYYNSIEGKIDYQIDVIHSREDYEDGQLKILTDLILTVDDMIYSDGNENKKILVVGSSSEGGVASGYAYEALPLMLRKSEIDLYDPYNNVGEVEVNGVKMTYYNKEKKLRENDIQKYDMLLDDAWEEKISRSWDYDGIYDRFKYYSVKWFDDCPDLPSPSKKANKYYQVFRTGEHELRLVSRNGKFMSYNQIPQLGNCPGCRELKFKLKNNYDSSLYRFYLACHKTNCIDKSIHRTVVRCDYKKSLGELSWYEINHQSNTSGYRVMYYDRWSDYFDVIPVNQVFENEKIVFSDFEYVTDYLYNKCFIIVDDGERMFTNVGGVPGFRYTGNQISVSSKYPLAFRPARKRDKVFYILYYLLRWKGLPRLVVEQSKCDYHEECDKSYRFYSITGYIETMSRCLLNFIDYRDMVRSVFLEIVRNYSVIEGEIKKNAVPNDELGAQFCSECDSGENAFLNKMFHLLNPAT